MLRYSVCVPPSPSWSTFFITTLAKSWQSKRAAHQCRQSHRPSGLKSLLTQVEVPGGRGVCAPAGGDVDGKQLQLCTGGGKICPMRHPPSVQQLLPARRPGTAALSPQCAPRRPKKGAATQITSALTQPPPPLSIHLSETTFTE